MFRRTPLPAGAAGIIALPPSPLRAPLRVHLGCAPKGVAPCTPSGALKRVEGGDFSPGPAHQVSLGDGLAFDALPTGECSAPAANGFMALPSIPLRAPRCAPPLAPCPLGTPGLYRPPRPKGCRGRRARSALRLPQGTSIQAQSPDGVGRAPTVVPPSAGPCLLRLRESPTEHATQPITDHGPPATNHFP